MGRKIPGKKHRKVKDPEKQREARFRLIKDKVNNPPTKLDQQEMPRSLLKIMELKDKAKNFKPKKRVKKKTDKIFSGGQKWAMPFSDERQLDSQPKLERRPGETIDNFCNRVNTTCNVLLKEAAFKEKFGVEVVRNSLGNIEEVKKIKAPKSSKKLKLKEKRKEKEKKKKESAEVPKEFAGCEKVEFGDIVHEPPSNLRIPVKKIKEKEDTSKKARPGKRSLLLKDMLKAETTDVTVGIPKQKLTNLQREKQEERRKTVVDAFRLLKKKL